MKTVRRAISMIIILSLHPLCVAQDSASVVSQNEIPYSFSFGYANDDFLLEKEINALFDTRTFPANDDLVTASFFLSASAFRNENTISVNAFYHILTDRGNNFRTDLLAVCISVEQHTPHTRIRAGAGFDVVGNLGGSLVQNGYHRLFGHQTVTFDYRRGLGAGVLLSGRGEVLLINAENTELSPFLAALYSSNVEIPNNVQAGMAYHVRSFGADWDLVVGYNHRFAVDARYASIFGASWYYGIMSNIAVTEAYSIAGWVTKNQFGVRSNMHFGLNVAWRSELVRSLRLSDITFP